VVPLGGGTQAGLGILGWKVVQVVHSTDGVQDEATTIGLTFKTLPGLVPVGLEPLSPNYLPSVFLPSPQIDSSLFCGFLTLLTMEDPIKAKTPA
jgi:hypothetical protein